MKKLVFASVFLLSAALSNAQTGGANAGSATAGEKTATQAVEKKAAEKKAEGASPVSAKLYGFIRNDMFFDSRLVTSARLGELSLYPVQKNLNSAGTDLNAVSSLTMLAITSRLGVAIAGPDAFGAKTSGMIEAEFFGNLASYANGTATTATGNENMFRLRQAYAKLDWKTTQLGFGQYWHPLFNVECFPGVLNFNTGIPFQPFARNPQIRLTQKMGKTMSFVVAASSQVEAFSSVGSTSQVAANTTQAQSPVFLYNAILPNLTAQLQYKNKSFLMGVTLDYKAVRPALYTAATSVGTTAADKTTTTVNGLSFQAYAKYTGKAVLAKAQFNLTQNLFDQTMIGGYLGYGNATGMTYKPINVSSMWFEIAGMGKKIIPGLFFGYTKNNGAKDAGAILAYGRGAGINKTAMPNLSLDHVYRVSPRLEFISNKFKFGTEIEVTGATYRTSGSDAKSTGESSNVTNTRILFSTTYSF